MAEDHGPSVKDDRLYEKLRDEGEGKEKAARIANAKAGGTDVSEKGGWAESYEDRTREELEARAVKWLDPGMGAEACVRLVADATRAPALDPLFESDRGAQFALLSR